LDMVGGGVNEGLYFYLFINDTVTEKIYTE